MFVNHAKFLGRMSLVLSAGAALFAQDVTGMLMGSVRDEQGRPLGEATVLIRAPQLIQPRRAMTDASGSFRVPLLPPGDYSIQVTRDGYIGQGAPNVRLSVGANIRQDFTLRKIMAMPEVTVEVTASTASMDKSEAKIQSSFSADQLLTLPTNGGRAFIGAADFAPGVVFGPGGGTTVRGGKTQETGFTLNGTSIKDEYEGRLTSVALIDDSVEDTQVIQSPIHARFGRTGGGIVNVVTKSGGNQFSGSARYYLGRNDWAAMRPFEEAEGTSNTYVTRKFDLFLSGPIIKDRLWFALSVIEQPSIQSEYIAGNGENTSDWAPWTFSGGLWNQYDPAYPIGGGWPFPYDIGTKLKSDQTRTFTNGKLTYAITGDHTVDFSYNETTYKLTNRNPYAPAPGDGTILTVGSHSLSQTGMEKYWSYGYRGILGSSTFLDARYTKVKKEIVFPAPDLPLVVLNMTTAGGYPYGLGITPLPDGRSNQSANINLKRFVEWAGTHEFDLGYDMFEAIRGTSTGIGPTGRIFWSPWATDFRDTQYGPANEALLDQYHIGRDPYGNRVAFPAVNFYDALAVGDASMASTAGQAPMYRQYFGSDGTTKNKTESIYLNDAWAINSHFNFMVGLRQDRFKVTDTDGSTLIKRNGPLSPRLMLRYDVDGAATHLFTFTGAKYVQDIPVGFTDAFIKKASSAWAMYGFIGVPQGTAGWTDYAGLTNIQNYDLAHPYRFSDARFNAQRADISNPFVYEFTAGYRRTYKDGSTIGITGIWKEWKNDFAISTDADPSYYVTVPDPTGTGLPSKLTLAARYGNSDLIKRSYKGVELEWREVVNSVWVFGGNYTYSRLRGNDQGGDNANQSFRVNGVQGALAYRNALLSGGRTESDFAPYGFLLNDQTHKARIYVVATMPIGKGRISYSAALKYDSGSVYSAAMNNSLASYLPAPGAGIPTFATTWAHFYGERGAFRFNDQQSVDVKIDYAIPVWGKVQVMGDIQINNVFNTQKQIGYTNTFSNTTVAYNAPIRVNSMAFGTDLGRSGNYAAGRTTTASIGLKF